jgi:hypothetical protein
MAGPAPLVRCLDSVDPFWNTDAEPIFPPEAMREVASVDDVEGTLLGIATDPQEPLARRFSAVEALFQGGWTDWREGEQAATIAQVMADAIREDRIHNRWGLPGHYLGRSGEDLLSIGRGVDEALTPLLGDDRPLTIHGSETATVAQMHRYRISDLAGYLLAKHRGQPWHDDPDPAVRDAENRA